MKCPMSKDRSGYFKDCLGDECAWFEDGSDTCCIPGLDATLLELADFVGLLKTTEDINHSSAQLEFEIKEAIIVQLEALRKEISELSCSVDSVSNNVS